MKETFNKGRVFTCVTADDIPRQLINTGIYGYFAHDVDSLSRAVENSRTSARCVYGKLTKVLSRENRARFVLDNGQFVYSLFYMTDTKLNKDRY